MPAHGRKFGQRSRHERHVHRHRRRAWLSGRRGTTGRPASAGLALVLLAVAIAIPAVRIAGRANGDGARDLVPIAKVPADDRRLGLVYQGLAPARRGTPCVGGYQVIAPDMCTHGPDEPPAGLDVHRDVPPVAPSTPTPALPRQNLAAVPGDPVVWTDAGAATEPATAAPATGAPALVPDAPADATRPDGVVCAGDGEAGKRVQVLYVYETGTASRYSQYLASFRAWAAGVDAIYAASAADTGGSRHVRYVTTPDCEVAVVEVEVPAGALDTFNATLTVLRTLGYDRADRKYLIFADANVYCGIATFTADDRPGPANRGNSGPGYGRADAGCWNPAVAAHELAHTLGAVQNGAPNSSGNGHCVDGYDVMCYQSRQANADGSAQLAAVSRTRCPNRMAVQRLDCGHDDYFHTNPEPGSYLATHWNVADSQFLIGGAGDTSDPAEAGDPAEAVSERDPDGADDPGDQPAGPANQAPATGATTGPGTGPPASGNGPPASGNRPSAPGNGPAGPGAAPPAPGQPDGASAGQGEPGQGRQNQRNGHAPDTNRPDQRGAPASPGASPGPHASPDPPAAQVPATAQTPAQAAPAVSRVNSTTVRLAWRPAGPNTRYGVLVNGVVAGWTTATAARVIGLRPATTYSVQVVAAGPNSVSRAYTAPAPVRTLPTRRPQPDSWFTLSNALTGGAATLYAARAGSGAPLVLQPGTGAANQAWLLQPAGDGSYLLRSRATGKCVIPRGGNPVPGAPLVQQSCPSIPAAGQRWQVTATAYGFALQAVDAIGGPLVVGVGVPRFGGDRLLVLQRPAQVRHQSWTVLS